jgi:hypothetical protein
LNPIIGPDKKLIRILSEFYILKNRDITGLTKGLVSWETKKEFSPEHTRKIFGSELFQAS